MVIVVDSISFQLPITQLPISAGDQLLPALTKVAQLTVQLQVVTDQNELFRVFDAVGAAQVFAVNARIAGRADATRGLVAVGEDAVALGVDAREALVKADVVWRQNNVFAHCVQNGARIKDDFEFELRLGDVRGVQRWVIAIKKKKNSITNYITNYFFTE